MARSVGLQVRTLLQFPHIINRVIHTIPIDQLNKSKHSKMIEAVLRLLNTRARKVLLRPPIVGVRDFVTTESHIPVRVFYPSSAKKEGTVGWFVRSYAYFIDGYFHTLLPWLREYAVVQWIIMTISFVLSWMLPMGNAYLPNCAYDASPLVNAGRKYPLIVFSHGLTGTGNPTLVEPPAHTIYCLC